MSAEMETAWTIARHMAELVAAHGLVEAGTGVVKHAAHRATEWLRAHLPAEDLPKLENGVKESSPGPARAGLELAIYQMLQARPELLDEIRALLAEVRTENSSQQQTVGDGSRAIQNRGDNNVISISG